MSAVQFESVEAEAPGAFPMRGAGRAVVAAVAVMAPADTFQPAKPAPLVSAAADAVSQQARSATSRPRRAL
ncbi:hypothetical protein ABZ960_13630 [Streptomyces pseudovenezuelae]|uniref:hypothetical protein n=1 Tax=Streptomyces pseudovenezuelae TaxID=67350 RepID=UPI0034A48FE0